MNKSTKKKNDYIQSLAGKHSYVDTLLKQLKTIHGKFLIKLNFILQKGALVLQVKEKKASRINQLSK